MLFETDHKIGVFQVSNIWYKILFSAYMVIGGSTSNCNCVVSIWSSHIIWEETKLTLKKIMISLNLHMKIDLVVVIRKHDITNVSFANFKKLDLTDRPANPLEIGHHFSFTA